MASKKQTKYVFVTGGVVSGLGKGIAAASLGTILKSRGFSINIQKCDPYLNTDAGTLNPAEHGEVFVTSDGMETDLDLGHYERFIDREVTRVSSLMSGQIYARVIADERQGKYLGKTVQIIPHITTAIQNAILEAGKDQDVHIVEIGGTVGDYESLAFLEAIRQFKHRVGAQNVLYVHVVYLPYLEASKELKTKPAQNTIRDLRETGIHADVIIARAERPVSEHILHKISLFSDVPEEGIVPLETVSTVYEVPLILEDAKLGSFVTDKLGLPRRKSNLKEWKRLVETIKHPDHKELKIGIVAKYMAHEDTYMSVFEAVKAAAWANGVSAKLVWVNCEKFEDLEQTPAAVLRTLDGIVVPGGFGSRGVEGKIRAADYAISAKMPYLGLCLGMQVGVIAFARQVMGTKNVNTTEVDPQVEHPVIDLMADQESVTDKGGTMRLGNYPCVLDKNSLSYKAYKQAVVHERHRHRYEFKNSYRDALTRAGLVLAGVSPDNHLVELIEIKDHPFFVASQYHPEYKSRPNRPHPLFDAFIKSVIKTKKAAGSKSRAAY